MMIKIWLKRKNIIEFSIESQIKLKALKIAFTVQVFLGLLKEITTYFCMPMDASPCIIVLRLKKNTGFGKMKQLKWLIKEAKGSNIDYYLILMGIWQYLSIKINLTVT